MIKLYWTEERSPMHAESLYYTMDCPNDRQSIPLKDPDVKLVSELKLICKFSLKELKLA